MRTNLSLEPTDDGYQMLADLPGFEKEEIDLRFDDGVLTIDGIEATYSNGVLEVVLPTVETVQDDSHRIDIE